MFNIIFICFDNIKDNNTNQILNYIKLINSNDTLYFKDTKVSLTNIIYKNIQNDKDFIKCINTQTPL